MCKKIIFLVWLCAIVAGQVSAGGVFPEITIQIKGENNRTISYIGPYLSKESSGNVVWMFEGTAGNDGMFVMTVQSYGYSGYAILGGVWYGFGGFIEKGAGRFTHELCDAKQLDCIAAPQDPDDPLTSGRLEGERVSGAFKGNRSFSATQIQWTE